MLMNYHELTMGQPRDTPSNRLQFRIICSVIVGAITYAVLTSGVLKPVIVTEGSFSGGEFVYKFTGRDYAASNSLVEAVARDAKVKERQYEKVLYTLFLDDPLKVNGRRQRFASGILLNDQTPGLLKDPAKEEEATTNDIRKAALMKMNEAIQAPTRNEIEDFAAHDLWPRLKYSTQKLPSVRAAVVQFTFTNGFVSALVHSYKVCCWPAPHS
jgi:hypothetical protein